MKVRIIPHKRASASWNLALEEALFLRAKENLLNGQEVQPIVKLYSFSRPSVILGYMQRLSEIDYTFCQEVNVDVTMRTTGGGSVYLGKNDMQYSLILPQNYSKELLKKINTGIIHTLQDVGFNPEIKVQNNHSVIRMKDKSFVFDAERRFKNLILHHGTTLIDNYDYEYMPQALKATNQEIHDMQSGNLWLKHHAEVREHTLIKSFERNLPDSTSVIKKDFTNEEIKLAKKLHKKFYTNKNSFSEGKKKFGICYLPTTKYDMESYTEKW